MRVCMTVLTVLTVLALLAPQAPPAAAPAEEVSAWEAAPAAAPAEEVSAWEAVAEQVREASSPEETCEAAQALLAWAETGRRCLPNRWRTCWTPGRMTRWRLPGAMLPCWTRRRKWRKRGQRTWTRRPVRPRPGAFRRCSPGFWSRKPRPGSRSLPPGPRILQALTAYGATTRCRSC